MVVLLILAGGATVSLASRGPSAAPVKIPVLMYHRIDDGPGHLSTSAATLDREMAWLRDHDYTAITPDDLADAIAGERALPARPVMLTDDDGYRSTLVFFNVVRKYGFRATYFWPNWAELSPDEMRAVAADGTICGHTVHHPDLTKLTLDQQEHEMIDNQQWLRTVTGQAVRCFAYPMGRSNDDSTIALRDSGFALAFDASGAESAVPAADRFHISRAAINDTTTLDQFIGLVTDGWGA